jgi:hypothetical protein
MMHTRRSRPQWRASQRRSSRSWDRAARRAAQPLPGKRRLPRSRPPRSAGRADPDEHPATTSRCRCSAIISRSCRVPREIPPAGDGRRSRWISWRTPRGQEQRAAQPPRCRQPDLQPSTGGPHRCSASPRRPSVPQLISLDEAHPASRSRRHMLAVRRKRGRRRNDHEPGSCIHSTRTDSR